MFQPYPKISEQLDRNAKLSGNWVATEKIHGANIALVCDKDTVQAARRKQLLDDSEYGSFFGLATIFPSLMLKMRALYQLINEPFICYGELYGGVYPGLETSDEIFPVQGGIYYSPKLEFAAFDLYLPKKDLWLSDTRLRSLADQVDLCVVPIIQIGSYQQLMGLPVKFKSIVAKNLGYNNLENNYAEGFVLKPDKDSTTDRRVIVKRKRKAFNETLSTKQTKLLTSHESWLVLEAARRLTRPRAQNAKSKVGTNQTMIANEIIEDIVLEISDLVGGISEGDYAILTRYLLAPALTLAELV